jgi:hypothetical protein
MAGERLFRTFDAARYQGILPSLDELRATRALSAGAHALLASLLEPAPERAMGDGHEALRRIVRHPALAPRVFLAPKQISSVIEFVVGRTCFEQDGKWSLIERGASWAVLESSVIFLYDDPWFDELLNGDRPGVWDAPYPRGEAAFRGISHELLGELVDRVRAILALDLERRRPLPEGLGMQVIRAELAELLALAARARGHGRGLATQVLL